MSGALYRRTVLVDSSAVIALLNPDDRFHQEAQQFFNGSRGVSWCALRATSHEAYTRVRKFRYPRTPVGFALQHFDFFRTPNIYLLDFDAADEAAARQILAQYGDQILSFHDALCAAVMLRNQLYRIFSFDRDFWTLGLEVVPGIT